MTCVSPPELDDNELLAYVDSEAEDRVVAHLDRCPHCRERAHQLARFQDWLTARLYRFNCPSPAELGEYHLGLLPDHQAAAIGQHLVECPRCAREVAQLQEYLAELTPELELSPGVGIVERVRVLVAQLVSGDWGFDGVGAPALAYAGVRGGDEGPASAEQERIYVYQADDVQITLEAQQDVEQPDRVGLLGLLTGMATQDVQVSLWQADQSVSTASVDDLGNFSISGVAPGSYELILSGPEVEVHIQDLEI